MHAAHTLLWTSPSSPSPPPPTLKGSMTPSLKVCLESWPPNLTSLQRCVFEGKMEWGAHCSPTGRFPALGLGVRLDKSKAGARRRRGPCGGGSGGRRLRFPRDRVIPACGASRSQEPRRTGRA